MNRLFLLSYTNLTVNIYIYTLLRANIYFKSITVLKVILIFKYYFF